jgi:hypothetical protein
MVINIQYRPAPFTPSSNVLHCKYICNSMYSSICCSFEIHNIPKEIKRSSTKLYLFYLQSYNDTYPLKLIQQDYAGLRKQSHNGILSLKKCSSVSMFKEF